MLVGVVVAVPSSAIEELSKGKAAGGVSRSDLIDSAPDRGVICSVSMVNALSVEE
jgi:hypothetical protein